MTLKEIKIFLKNAKNNSHKGKNPTGIISKCDVNKNQFMNLITIVKAT